MRKKVLLPNSALLALLSLALLWSVAAMATHHEPAAVAVKNVYVCGCGPAANCNMVQDQPGNAPCGRPLVEKPVLKEDADKIYVCACGDGCKCSLNQADPAKCACGTELRAYPKPGTPAASAGMAPAASDSPCAGCPKKADCAGCPNMPAAGQQPPCAGCPKMPAAQQ